MYVILQNPQGRKGVMQTVHDLRPCKIHDFKVWDVEAHESTSIALMIGHADPKKYKNA